MPRKSRDEYDLRPNMHDKPNSQGTLFRAPVSTRKPEMRQPRGYSPERRDAVERSIRVYNLADSQTEPQRRNDKARNQLIESLARTRMPIRDISSAAPGGFNVNADLQKGAAAQYNPRRKWIDVGRDQADKSGYIAHEVAHGLSFNKVTWHSAQYGMWDGATGAEEGQADAYAKRMNRAPGYKSRGDNFRTGYMDRVAKEPNTVWSVNYTGKQLHDVSADLGLDRAIKQPRWRQDALFEPIFPDYDYNHSDHTEGGVRTWMPKDETPALRKSKFPRGSH